MKCAVRRSGPLGEHGEVAVDSGAVAGRRGHRRQLGRLRPAENNVTLCLPWNRMCMVIITLHTRDSPGGRGGLVVKMLDSGL